MTDETKICPDCAETVKAAAKKCRYCGHAFSEPGLFGKAAAAGMKAATESATAQAEKAKGRSPENIKKTNIGCSIALVAVLGIAIVGSWSDGDKNRAADVKSSAVDAEQRQKGFHCLSQWDGSNRSTAQQVKATLRNPDSFEHIETKITPLDKATGEHHLAMKYRAQNGFGGMNVEQVYARINNGTCDARIL